MCSVAYPQPVAPFATPQGGYAVKTLSALLASALLSVQVAWATPITLAKVSKNSGIDYATAFSLSLQDAGTQGSALLQLQNGSASAARISRVFIQAPVGAIPGSWTGDLAIQLAPVQVLGDFDVQLLDPGPLKLNVVKAVKDATGLGLDAARISWTTRPLSSPRV